MRMNQQIILFTLFVPGLLLAQWLQRNSGTSKSLCSIYFLDAKQGWIVYPDSCLLTKDGGMSWQAVKVTGVNDTPLYDVAFINFGGFKIGMATSNNGQVYSSFDSGTSWTKMSLPSRFSGDSFFGISFIGNDFSDGVHTWIVGTFGKIAYSPNYGSSWTQQDTGDFRLNDVYFVDKDSGWAVGNNGTIRHTSSGGHNASWVRQTSGMFLNLNGVWFFNHQIGWIVGEQGLILKTENGGRDWQPQDSGTNKNLTQVSFSDSSNGVVVGENGVILHTKDGGKIWRNESGIVNTNINLLGVFYVKSNLENCWVVGTDGALLYSQGSVTIKSPNGGESWEGGTRQTITWDSEYLKNVKIELSTNDGQNWQPLPEADGLEAATGSFPWTLPTNVNSERCRIRISGLATKSDVHDSSDRAFTICIPDHTPPTIVADTLITAIKGENIKITSRIFDDSRVDTAKLFFRLAGKRNFNIVGMTREARDNFTATIPWQDEALLRGFQFYIEAKDASCAANDTTLPMDRDPQKFPIFIPVRISNYSQSIFTSVPKDAKYQMLSIPMVFEQGTDDGSIESVLVDDLGPYDPENWRLYRWITEEKKLREYGQGDIGSFAPGVAFWLVSRKATFVIEAGKSVRSDMFSEILLKPGQDGDPKSGWYQIGNPFAFSVSWRDIKAASGIPENIVPFHYNPDKKSYEVVDVLCPWNGYFIKNSSAQTITLKIPPIDTLCPTTQLSYIVAKSTSNMTAWKLQILASCKNVVEDFNFAGVNAFSDFAWDRNDYPEPPPVGDYVSLYFPHLDWQKYPDHYTTDFRPVFQDGQVWDFVVETNIVNAKVEIAFCGVESVPNEFGVYLLDGKLKISQNLRHDPGYSFPTANGTLKKQLRLAIGKSVFFQRHNLQITSIPLDYELSQNFPNPFNPATAIRFGLPVPSMVTLKIYTTLGEEVAVLLDNELKGAGYHVQTWNGVNKHGQEVHSGIYFYRLKAGAFSDSKKMLLIK
jgi:photosystem II stability/assembly factor-like uncharacterized protein